MVWVMGDFVGDAKKRWKSNFIEMECSIEAYDCPFLKNA